MSKDEWIIFTVIEAVLLIPVLFFKVKEDD